MYRIGMSLLKFLEDEEDVYVIAEVHKGISGQNLRGRALANKILRDEYYWLSMIQDSKIYVKKCKLFQKHEDVYLAPSSKLSSFTLSFPFFQPFPLSLE